MSRKQPRVSPTMAILALSALMAGQTVPPAGTAPARGDGQRAVKTQANTVRQAAGTSTQGQQQLAQQLIGDDPKRRRPTPQGRRINPERQLRRRMEELGYVTSGRQWRKLRKAMRRYRKSQV